MEMAQNLRWYNLSNNLWGPYINKAMDSVQFMKEKGKAQTKRVTVSMKVAHDECDKVATLIPKRMRRGLIMCVDPLEMQGLGIRKLDKQKIIPWTVTIEGCKDSLYI